MAPVFVIHKPVKYQWVFRGELQIELLRTLHPDSAIDYFVGFNESLFLNLSLSKNVLKSHTPYAQLTDTSFPFHIWRYSPFRAVASLIRRLYTSLFSAIFFHPLFLSSWNVSLCITSTHLVLGHPTGLVVYKFQFKTFFGIFFFHSHYVTCQSLYSDFNVLHDVWLIVQTVQFTVPFGIPAPTTYVLGHIFFVIFSFQAYLASVLPFVLVFRPKRRL